MNYKKVKKEPSVKTKERRLTTIDKIESRSIDVLTSVSEHESDFYQITTKALVLPKLSNALSTQTVAIDSEEKAGITPPEDDPKENKPEKGKSSHKPWIDALIIVGVATLIVSVFYILGLGAIAEMVGMVLLVALGLALLFLVLVLASALLGPDNVDLLDDL